jgi:NitT/TauT family transport system ATP-binding protein
MQPAVAPRAELRPAATAAARPLIELAGVAKTYRTRDGEVESLRPLTFDIGNGEFLAIVGPSGCGKSTLLKMVAGLLPATQGRITLNGRTVDGPPDDVGIVFQSPVLLAWRSVLANVMLQIEMRHLPRAQYLPKARALLAMAGLGDFERKLPWQLSGGMQQRASI